MSLQLRDGEAWVMLPAAEHGALAIGTPAHRQQGQILLKALEPAQLVPPWRWFWRMLAPELLP
ncbi:hypothetical protein [Vulcanococcus sp.]|uniref:hypothetical protein n=1 Tax=Vulcanococcus sp. TaxID=2856995 RepID=UPI0037D99E51